jgi:hypothetical protein
MKTPTFARGVVGTINCFLHVTAGFFQNLPHLTSHIRGERVLIPDENFAQTEEYFRTPWSGSMAPAIKGPLRCIGSSVYVIAG